MKKIIHIDGMHCEHCQQSAEKALLGIEGVKKCKVNLRKKEAVINFEIPIDDNIICHVIDAAGYKVVSINDKKNLFF